MTSYVVESDTPSVQKIEAWLELLKEMFVRLDYVSGRESADLEFRATVDHRLLSWLDTHVVTSTRQSLRRGTQRASDHEGEFFLFVMQTIGTGEVTQDDRRAILAPGDFTMYDTTRPYGLDFASDFQQFVFRVPRDELRFRVADAERLTAYRMPGSRAVGRLLREVVRGLPAAMEEGDADVLSSIADSVTDLIAANLRAAVPAGEPLPSKVRRYHETRIKAFIKENAADPELTVKGIAETLGMSVSALYRAFESQQVTVAEMLWSERLATARQALRSRVLSNKSIKEIAFESGFTDAGHFSRLFRQRFGKSPRQYRASEN